MIPEKGLAGQILVNSIHKVNSLEKISRMINDTAILIKNKNISEQNYNHVKVW